MYVISNNVYQWNCKIGSPRGDVSEEPQREIEELDRRHAHNKGHNKGDVTRVTGTITWFLRE